jgi:hypothetical protein
MWFLLDKFHIYIYNVCNVKTIESPKNYEGNKI